MPHSPSDKTIIILILMLSEDILVISKEWCIKVIYIYVSLRNTLQTHNYETYDILFIYSLQFQQLSSHSISWTRVRGAGEAGATVLQVTMLRLSKWKVMRKQDFGTTKPGSMGSDWGAPTERNFLLEKEIVDSGSPTGNGQPAGFQQLICAIMINKERTMCSRQL